MSTPIDFYGLSPYPEDPPSSIPITVQHPTPDTAVFELEGVTYTATREKVRPGISMLLFESAFYRRFGRGEEVLTQVRDSFSALDRSREESTGACTASTAAG